MVWLFALGFVLFLFCLFGLGLGCFEHAIYVVLGYLGFDLVFTLLWVCFWVLFVGGFKYLMFGSIARCGWVLFIV